MCSRMRGPASAPSFVTCPTKTSVIPWLFAMRVRRAALAHLRDRPRSAVELPRKERLNRVDHDEFGLFLGKNRFNLLEFDFAHELQPVRIDLKALRADRDLRGAFFARNVEGADAQLLQAGHHLKENRRLPDPGVPADQRHASAHEAAAHHAVEFAQRDPEGTPSCRRSPSVWGGPNRNGQPRLRRR